MVEFSNGFLLFDSLDSIKLDLTLGASLEPTDRSSDLSVVVEVVSESGDKVVQLCFILKDNEGNYFFSDFGKSYGGSVLQMDE